MKKLIACLFAILAMGCPIEDRVDLTDTCNYRCAENERNECIKKASEAPTQEGFRAYKRVCDEKFDLCVKMCNMKREEKP